MFNCLLASVIGFSLQWEADCQQRVAAARILAKQDVGILVTTRPGWLPGNLYKLAFRYGVSQRPSLAEIFVHIADDESIVIQGETLDLDSAKERLIQLRTQIDDLTGTNNVHVQFVFSQYDRVTKSTAYDRLHQFAYDQEFVSTGCITSDGVLTRKQNLDPRNLMKRDDG